MILSIPALNWAAVRSGLGLGDFMASLTPEKEESILAAYNDWRKSKGLKPEGPVSPIVTVAQEEGPKDDLSVMMEAVAEEIEEEEAAEAAEIAHTIEEIDAIDVPADDTPIPEEVEEQIIIADDDAAPPTVIDAVHVSDDHTGGQAADAATPEQTYETVEEKAVPIEQRIDKLPKDATPPLYEDILASMAGDVDMLKSVTETVIKDHTRRHRGTAAQRQFLSWLEEHTPAHTNEQ